MKSTVLFLCSLLAGYSTSAQWVNQAAPLPAASLIHDNVSVIDARTVWTTDLETGTPNGRLLNSYVSRTTDGGVTWNTAALPGLALTDYSITSLHALNATTAWLSIATPGNAGSRLLKTTDGGQTWLTQSTTVGTVPRWVRFLDATTGVAVCQANSLGNFTAYTTTDGGTTWTRLPDTALPPAQSAENPYLVSLGVRPLVTHSGGVLWFATSAGRVFRTADGGQSWSVAASTLSEIRHIQFRDELHGIVMDLGGNISRTTDGGRTWVAVTPRGPVHTVGLTDVPGSNVYLSTGFTGSLNGAGTSISTDDGQTWTALESTREHTFVDFASTSIGWSVGVIRPAGTSSFQNGGMNRFDALILAKQRPKTAASVVAYPNPSNTGHFAVQLAERVHHLRVLDATGRIVLDTPAPTPTGSGLFSVSLAHSPVGLYLLELQTAAGLMRTKLLVR